MVKLLLTLQDIIKKIDHALFKGNLTALPNVVVDLARFNPAKITIFHADLMLNKKKMN